MLIARMESRFSGSISSSCTSMPKVVSRKQTSSSTPVESMMPLLDDETTVVTSSNGLPYWFFDVDGVPYQGTTLATLDPGGRQRRYLRAKRAVGCVVFPATEIVAPGVIRHEHGGKFPIGEPDGRHSTRIEQLHNMLEAAGFEAPIRSDIRDELWLKLWGNQCFNPVSALTGATIDVVTTDPETRATCLSMMREMQAIGERLGLHLRVDAERRLAGAAALGPHKMSMLQDLEHGRPLELDEVVGAVIELGKIAGVPTPIASAIYACVKLLDRMNRQP